MEIIFSSQEKIYKKLVHDGQYDPFSQKFNHIANTTILKEAEKLNLNQNIISIIKAGPYLNNTFHKQLTQTLKDNIQKLPLSVSEIKEFFMALVNEIELINKEEQKSFLDSTEELTAFDLKNAVGVFKESPNLPQNYTSRSEMNVDFANLIFRFLMVVDNPKGDANEENCFHIIENVWQLANVYHGIKNHYESCLFYYGKIDILSPNKITFDSTKSGLVLLERISTTFIDDLKIGRFYQCLMNSNSDRSKNLFMMWGSERKLSTATLEGGFIKYKTTRRRPEDFTDYLDAVSLITDMYPFFSKKALTQLQNLTLMELLHLFMEVKLLVWNFYDLGLHKMNEYNIKKLKALYLPKIKHSVLKSYLLSVTIFSENQIEAFIKLMIAKEGRDLEFYYAPFVRESDYYYFPYFPLVNTNYLFLLDFWLEEAKESLKDRGYALEKYIKEELARYNNNGSNCFKISEKSYFVNYRNETEEIDLVIETKNTIIIAEIKCIKYPLNPRGYYTYFNDTILKAHDQLLRKANFLTINQKDFSDIICFDGKKIIKTIIVNYPCFTGGSVKGIPITDMTTFLSYFRTDRMKIAALSTNNSETVEEYKFYSNEEEFCNNFSLYLRNPPYVVKTAKSFSNEMNSITLENGVKLSFMSLNPVSSKSKFIEG
jgi:hypothetical protein